MRVSPYPAEKGDRQVTPQTRGSLATPRCVGFPGRHYEELPAANSDRNNDPLNITYLDCGEKLYRGTMNVTHARPVGRCGYSQGQGVFKEMVKVSGNKDTLIGNRSQLMYPCCPQPRCPGRRSVTYQCCRGSHHLPCIRASQVKSNS
jgi:hypothetical protein